MFNQKLFNAELERLRQMFPECHIEAFTPDEYKIADATLQYTEAPKVAEYLYTHTDSVHMWQLVHKAIEYAKNVRSLY
jgi:hypothetical protein